MVSLESLREEINGIDAEMTGLLRRRAAVAKNIALEKRRLGLPLHNPEREAEVLERLGSASGGDMPPERLRAIYRAIMGETLAMERDFLAGTACGGEAGFVPNDGRKVDRRAVIAENLEVAPGFFRMRLTVPGLGDMFRPGQFFQLRIDPAAGATFLRRPFAPSETSPDGIAFVYAVVGEGTRRLCGMRPGGAVSILAPLGSAYTLPEPGSAAVLLGGGCGAPSLRPLAERMASDGVQFTAVVGARTACGLLEKEFFSRPPGRLIVATDDGTLGIRGNVLDALAAEWPALSPSPSRVYACGPVPMLRAAAAFAAERGVPCEVSLEERMACGFGACVGCAVKIRDKQGVESYARVCHDGPVFDAAALIW